MRGADVRERRLSSAASGRALLPVRGAPASRGTGADRLLVWGTSLLVVWATLAFGGVYPWAFWPLLAGVSLVGIMALASVPRTGTMLSSGLTVSLALAALAIVIQLIPVSSSLLQILSPNADAYLRESNIAYAFERGSGPAWHPLSLSPRDTLRFLLFFVTLSLFVAGMAAVLARTGTRTLGGALAVIGVLVAALGISHAGDASGLVYGFWKPVEGGNAIFGPFVNKNHFAGWMAMALGVVLGTLCGRLVRLRHPRARGLRARLLQLVSDNASKLWLNALAASIMALSLVMTASRSGVGALLAATVILGVFVLRRQRTSRRGLLAAGVLVAVVGVALLWGGPDRLLARFQNLPGSNVGGRLAVWRDTARMSLDFPLTGVGMNSYGRAMLRYQRGGQEPFFAAHNDYLQLLAEGGLLVSVPFLMVLAFFVREVVRRFAERQDDARTYWIRAGAVSGLGAIALQEIVDFSLQIPANALLFCVLGAIAIHRPVPRPPGEVR